MAELKISDFDGSEYRFDIVTKKIDEGVLASKLAAEIYNLDILETKRPLV